MLELYYAPTPNGWKITIMLEECGLPYEIKPVNIAAGDQLEADFLRMNPNARMPVLRDADAGDEPLVIFESGAILLYLAETRGRFIPDDKAGRYEVVQWLFWQMANLGPVAGHSGHFVNYADGGADDYARKRFTREYQRLMGAMNFQLSRREWLAGDYSIADMACFPWLLGHKRLGADMEAFPHLRRWYETMKQRPAVRRGVDVERGDAKFVFDESVKRRLFEQDASIYENLC